MTSTSVCNLVEWIEYNLELGVNHIYLTDDCSTLTEGLHAIVGHYQALGVLTMIKSYEEHSDCATYTPNEGATYRRMFFPKEKLLDGGNARDHCQWIMNLDYDEYITFWRYDDPLHKNNLAYYLKSYPYSFVRLPWWVMKNGNHEARPQGVVTEAYLGGSLEKPWYIKTIALAKDIANFQNPHWPQVHQNMSSLALVNTSRPLRRGVPRGSGMTVLQYTAWNTLHDEEKSIITIPVTPNRGGGGGVSARGKGRQMMSQRVTLQIPVPDTEMFLKHYKYLSWEEFRLQRASTPTLPNGRTNYWSRGGRQLWEKGNSTGSGVRRHLGGGEINIAAEFTGNMTVRLKDALARRYKYLGNDASPAYRRAQRLLKRDCGGYWQGFL